MMPVSYFSKTSQKIRSISEVCEMETQYLPPDYRSSMQQAAFAYLRRHEAQHLVDSDLLYENCVRHLTTALEVPVFMAQKLVHNAWTEMTVGVALISALSMFTGSSL